MCSGCCLQRPPRRRPGPSWGTLPTEVCASLLRPFNWAPAFAGVVGKEVGVRAGSLPLRGTSLVVRVLPKTTTPAEAGAQLGDVAD